MDERLVFITIGLVVGYLLFRYINNKQLKQKDNYSDILSNNKFKVKGQWDK
ncbi:MAG: hypothetical protein ABIC91_04255 [Nanoarchaeota archaeon]